MRLTLLHALSSYLWCNSALIRMTVPSLVRADSMLCACAYHHHALHALHFGWVVESANTALQELNIDARVTMRYLHRN